MALCGFAGEEFEASNNPGYSEAHELAYMQEDKERYTELVKKAMEHAHH